MQKNRGFMRLFCIITRFWCGRQVSAIWAEHRDMGKAREDMVCVYHISRVNLHIIIQFARLFLWCPKAFQIRTGRGAVEFRKEYCFCSVLVVKGKGYLVIIKVYRIDKPIY